jgi:hypothetical protein
MDGACHQSALAVATLEQVVDCTLKFPGDVNVYVKHRLSGTGFEIAEMDRGQVIIRSATLSQKGRQHSSTLVECE